MIQIVQILRHSSRQADILARYGGEEFVSLLPQTSQQEAYVVAERLRAMVEGAAIELEGQIIHLTVSIGVAGVAALAQGENAENLLKQADAALYQAKNAGRNQVVLYSQGAASPG